LPSTLRKRIIREEVELKHVTVHESSWGRTSYRELTLDGAGCTIIGYLVEKTCETRDDLSAQVDCGAVVSVIRLGASCGMIDRSWALRDAPPPEK